MWGELRQHLGIFPAHRSCAHWPKSCSQPPTLPPLPLAPRSIFDYASVVPAGGAPGVHAPAVELLSRSKLSCLSWNKYIQAHIASSDYEGGLCGEAGRLSGGVFACGGCLWQAPCWHAALTLSELPGTSTGPPPLSTCAGVVAVWDVTSGALLHEYEAHSKRIWSVDFCEVRRP